MKRGPKPSLAEQLGATEQAQEIVNAARELAKHWPHVLRAVVIDLSTSPPSLAVIELDGPLSLLDVV